MEMRPNPQCSNAACLERQVIDRFPFIDVDMSNSKLVIFCSFSLNLPGRKNTNLHSPLGMLLLLLLLKPSWRLRLLLWLNVRFMLIMNGILGKTGIFPSCCCMSSSFHFPHLVLMQNSRCSMCRMLTSVSQSWKQFRSNELRFLDATCHNLFLYFVFSVLLMILS